MTDCVIGSNITTMKYVTIKVLEETRRLLRLIAAQTGEQMVQVLQRLCVAEWEQIRNSQKLVKKLKHTHSDTKPIDDADTP